MGLRLHASLIFCDGFLYNNKALVGALKKLGYADGRVAEAMLQVDRKDFVPGSEIEYAYLDTPLPIGYGVTTSAPSIVARMLLLLEVKKGMHILEIGVGSGYQTALLSRLVGEKGKVLGIEINPELVKFADANLEKYRLSNIEIVVGSGMHGYKKDAPYDRIIYSAALREIPQEAVNQLGEDGKLIAPVGDFYQTLILVEKKKGKEQRRNLDLVVFSPMM